MSLTSNISELWQSLVFAQGWIEVISNIRSSLMSRELQNRSSQSIAFGENGFHPFVRTKGVVM